MPSLTTVEIFVGFYEAPDNVELLLQACGAGLVTLNLRVYHELGIDVQSILALCPNLTTFSFNITIDWNLRERATSSLPRHQKLSRIGFYSDIALFDFPHHEGEPTSWVIVGQVNL